MSQETTIATIVHVNEKRHLASFRRGKRQRPTGGSKNVFHIWINNDHISRHDTDRIMHEFGAEFTTSIYTYTFFKRRDAEKAWAYLRLRYE